MAVMRALGDELVRGDTDFCCDDFEHHVTATPPKLLYLAGVWKIYAVENGPRHDVHTSPLRFCPWCGAGINLDVPAPPAGTA